MKEFDSAKQPVSAPIVVYLGLGSNMGDRKDNLDKSLTLLSQVVEVEQVSSIYDTEPVGNTEQPRFLNQVCRISTRLAPLELLILVKGIESQLGRIPGESNSPRPMDIDILFYGDHIMNNSLLTIPHPRIIERAFVLVPLAEISPELVHPLNGKTAREMLENLNTGSNSIIKWQES